MKKYLLALPLLLIFGLLHAQSEKVTLSYQDDGVRLLVNGKPFMINGMNWDYFPIGTNYNYSLWKQPDDIIKAALDAEMSLLQNMGVNVARMYTGVPAKWITYCYEQYGVYTMLNHTFGRYGLTLDGAWVAQTEYDDPRVRELLLAEVKQMAMDYKDTPGLLLYMLGNENNYGLFWEGAETEDIPVEDRKSTIRARHMYKLFNEGMLAVKAQDSNHPVALCNGDLLFLDIIAEECPDTDIFGTNVYRGESFGDLFERVKNEYGKPVLFAEFGSDAFNALENQEDQYSQAYYMVKNWEDIYANAAGMGKAGNCIGGFTFQFSDGWWKYGQTKNLSVHDNNASWPNGGYTNDFKEGENNMNEEWFGVCAKGPTSELGLYSLYPRAAYYALKEAHQFNVYGSDANGLSLTRYFDELSLMDAVVKARGDKAALQSESTKKIRLSGMRAELTTFNTGGKYLTTPETPDPTVPQYPDQLGFDHMESFFFDVEANPSASIKANVSINFLGNVAQNPIDEIFYENRGRRTTVNSDQGNVTFQDRERFKLYRANFTWNAKDFDLTGFYRTGHYHWGYEGDFFGLYPEANYGPNIDIYNGEAPFGFEVSGKKKFKGLKLAFGPELWWGANPAILLKYQREMAGWKMTGIFHEDIARQAPAVSSIAVPQRPTRRATLAMEKEFGKIGVQLGGIWGGKPFVGETFQIVDGETGNYTVYQDQIEDKDTWGGKLKVTYKGGKFNWYAQTAAMGLVANGGGDWTKTFTGWRLKDSGSGNQFNFLTGFTIGAGNWQIAPNFLWQKPVVDPIPGDVQAPGRPRNILDDPFAVRANREAVAGELLLTYDPTPGTWMYEWDNDFAEDAPFAASVGFVFRHHPTTMDAAIGIFADGRTTFAFPGAAPAQDLWEVNARLVRKVSTDFGWIANLYAGNAQANGSDPRLIERVGGDLRMIYKKIKFASIVKVDDWGPFDYYRDFNLTFPLQLSFDLSMAMSNQSWYNLPNTRLGIKYTWRSLDQYSPRYCPTHKIDAAGDHVCDPEALGFDNGREWEIRTYFHINIGG